MTDLELRCKYKIYKFKKQTKLAKKLSTHKKRPDKSGRKHKAQTKKLFYTIFGKENSSAFRRGDELPLVKIIITQIYENV